MIDIKRNEEEFTYLAIGNSLTLHGFADYWWSDDRGMASSEINKDYVHLIKSSLESLGKKVTLCTRNLAAWEVNADNRSQHLYLIENCLSDKPDLVTIQLGENAVNLETWEKDFSYLLSYTKTRCPGSQILVIGDFWSNGDRDKQKENVCSKMGIQYVSLVGIKDNSEYFAGLGTVVNGKDGDRHVIEHEGVANHPGDNGMKAIAERIITKIHI